MKSLNKIHILIILLLPILFCRCKETYDPEIDLQQPVVVVDGLITDLNEQYVVKLSMARPFNSTSPAKPLSGAIVTIKDNHGASYLMKESSTGTYVTDPAKFRGKPGSIYRLNIVTLEGDTYESSPQELIPAAVIDSVYGELTEQEYITEDVYGRTTGRMETGPETYADFHSSSGPDTHYRIKSKIMIGYTTTDYKTEPFPTTLYHWKKFDQNKVLNVTGVDNSLSSEIFKKYSILFFPVNSFLYNLADSEHLQNFYLQIRHYSLNQDAYSFYREVSKQLSATGKLFDPVATQINGNITCQNDPSKIALGFFEVSACTKETYWVKPLLGDHQVKYGKSYDLDNIPDSGMTAGEPPYFWKY